VTVQAVLSNQKSCAKYSNYSKIYSTSRFQESLHHSRVTDKGLLCCRVEYTVCTEKRPLLLSWLAQTKN